MFVHRLALALGRTVSDLLEQMTASELRDWQQFDRQAGLPDVASQWQRAQAVAMQAASNGARLEAKDYMPLISWDPQPATAQQIAEVFRGKE